MLGQMLSVILRFQMKSVEISESLESYPTTEIQQENGDQRFLLFNSSFLLIT